MNISGHHLALILKRTESQRCEGKICRPSSLCHFKGESQLEISLSGLHFLLLTTVPAGMLWGPPNSLCPSLKTHSKVTFPTKPYSSAVGGDTSLLWTPGALGLCPDFGRMCYVMSRGTWCSAKLLGACVASCLALGYLVAPPSQHPQ